MSFKKTVEDNVVIFLITISITAFGMGWAACEYTRVLNKTEKISDLEKKITDQSQLLKDKNSFIEPYQKQIIDLIATKERLETSLNNSEINIGKNQEIIQFYKNNNDKLQQNILNYASNCNVLSLINEIEKKKESVERSLTSAHQWDSEIPKIEYYKRQSSDYQNRLVSLQDKLTCTAH